jgi:plastocyanin
LPDIVVGSDEGSIVQRLSDAIERATGVGLLPRSNPGRRWRIGVCVVVALVLSGSAIAMQDLAAGAVLVTQKSRSFQPGSVELEKRQTLHIVNDDGRLMHHAYVASPNFNFDSGEQFPGTTVDIRFPAAGPYVVLCGIHPKMRLNVTVH